MNKLIALLLGVILALSVAAALAEPVEERAHEDTGTAALDGSGEYTYLAFTWGYTGGSVPGTPMDMTDTSRVIQMLMPGCAKPAALLLPDDCGPPEDYSFKGVMITVDMPIRIESDGLYVIVDDLPDLMAPMRVEIVGDVFYGHLTEVGTDDVTLDIYEEFVGNSAEKIRRFAVTERTMIFILDELQLKPWQGAVIVGTPEGEALAIHLSRG